MVRIMALASASEISKNSQASKARAIERSWGPPSRMAVSR